MKENYNEWTCDDLMLGAGSNNATCLIWNDITRLLDKWKGLTKPNQIRKVTWKKF